MTADNTGPSTTLWAQIKKRFIVDASRDRRISLDGFMEALMWHWFSGKFWLSCGHSCVRFSDSNFVGWVILLGSFFEKQVIKVDFVMHNGTENDKKVTLGRPKSRPWSDHGSDALSGAPVCVWRGGLFPTFRSILGDFFGPLFDDISETTFLMKKVVFLKTGVSSRREYHFWRSGADLEGLGSDQNRPKVLPERSKRAI